MAYFRDQYPRLSYPVGAGTISGLYNAQIGAIHALAAHFTVDTQPAIVTMPTGSGKTAVLMMAPFVLQSARTLVVTPSRLVRGQIADEFRTLGTLRQVGVFPDNLPLPRVIELDQRIASQAQWESLREYDVVVTTPNCASPGYVGIPVPPDDLFDLLLIDEAHHSPARTWTSLLAAFLNTRRALFSATPFRRDRAEISGRFVYSYPIARAFADDIFGRIAFLPVTPGSGESADLAIAKKAADVFSEDRQNGLDHCLMVRTDGRMRAEALAKLYEDDTSLRLKVVHSGLSTRTVKSILRGLDEGSLDGVICVNMMGEGFNFPRLKIAAVHSPHKSLEVTLQFIGRFARTNAPNIGDAKFIAVLSEIEFERQRLFAEGAVWEEIIPDLSYGRIAAEVHIREILQDFDDPLALESRLSDLSLYSLYPRSHVKIYDVPNTVDLRHTAVPDIGRELCYTNTNVEGTVLVMITKAVASPKWSTGAFLVDRAYDLVVVYFDPASRLLFINSSRSVDGTYETLADALSNGTASPLAIGQVGRVVRDITNQRIFNVGMRNIQAANTRESYKILAASDAQIDPSDARRYRQGHVFLNGEEAGSRTTIGYSSGAKVWSTNNLQIPDLLDWCNALGRKIRSVAPVVTHSGLDYLDAGSVAAAIPEHLIYVQWNKDAFDFTTPVQVEYTKGDGTKHRTHILDLELTLDRGNSTQDRLRVVCSGDGLVVPIDFTLNEFYSVNGAPSSSVMVAKGNQSMDLIDYLNEFYLDFYTADGSLFSGNELFAAKELAKPIGDQQIMPWDWSGVDIESEVAGVSGQRSVHDKVSSELQAGPAGVILYDHGTGEVADYITVTETAEATVFAFYHCKGSQASTAGARLEDVYEVCGQAQKSVAWASLARLERRLRARRQGARFVRGTPDLLQEILARAKDRRQRFEIRVVQPGISKARLSPAMAECLGATNGHLLGVGIGPFEVLTSS